MVVNLIYGSDPNTWFSSASYSNVVVTPVPGYSKASERDVESVEIPGRNGDLLIDRGRFKNVEITYKLVIKGSSESDYRSTVSTIKNKLMSFKGYHELSDSYDTQHYRMACLTGNLEPISENPTSGVIEITFNCKPQRFFNSPIIGMGGTAAIDNVAPDFIYPEIVFNAVDDNITIQLDSTDLDTAYVFRCTSIPTGTTGKVYFEQNYANCGVQVTHGGTTYNSLTDFISAYGRPFGFPSKLITGKTSSLSASANTIYSIARWEL